MCGNASFQEPTCPNSTNALFARAAEKQRVLDTAERISRHIGAPSTGVEAIRLACSARLLLQPQIREVSEGANAPPPACTDPRPSLTQRVLDSARVYNSRSIAWPVGGTVAVPMEHAAAVASVSPGAVFAFDPAVNTAGATLPFSVPPGAIGGVSAAGFVPLTAALLPGNGAGAAPAAPPPAGAAPHGLSSPPPPPGPASAVLTPSGPAPSSNGHQTASGRVAAAAAAAPGGPPPVSHEMHRDPAAGPVVIPLRTATSAATSATHETGTGTSASLSVEAMHDESVTGAASH